MATRPLRASSPIQRTRLQYLLAYLPLHPGESLKRSRIAYTFWLDSEEMQVLTNFRNLLLGLRHALHAQMKNAAEFLRLSSELVKTSMRPTVLPTPLRLRLSNPP